MYRSVRELAPGAGTAGCDVFFDWDAVEHVGGDPNKLRIHLRSGDTGIEIFAAHADDIDEWDPPMGDVANNVYYWISAASRADGVLTQELARRAERRRAEGVEASRERAASAEELTRRGDDAARGARREAVALYREALGKMQPGDEPDLDRTIRLKLIASAAALHLAASEETRKHAETSQRLLEDGAEIGAAEREMRAAVEASPWWLDGYYDLGMLQAGAKQYGDAIESLRLFVDAAPRDVKNRAARDKLDELEAEAQ